ncbi:MAG TPA: ribosome recycling factor [Vicinamibacterales bacterium]|nr:ribosome recycling factor [Vicinamibacterales bacterium]
MELLDLKELRAEVGRRMDGAIEHVRKELAGVRTGRASASMLEPVHVEAYGTSMPLNQVASLSVPEPAMIVVQPFDASLTAAIDRGIQKANLGLNPMVDGKILRVPIPPLTEERRRELSRLVHKYAEDSRNAVRQVRRDANDRLKRMLKDHQVSEDEERRALDEVQKVTDEHVAMIDEMQKKKDHELLGK